MENYRTELLKIKNEIIEESIRRGGFDITVEQAGNNSEHQLHKHAKSTPENSTGLLFNKEADKYQESLQTLNALADNRAFRPISSHRKLLGSIIIFFKRIVRKLLKWYIEPISEQQTDFNFATIGAITSTNNSVSILYQNNLETMSCVSGLIIEVEKLKKSYLNLKKAQTIQNEAVSNICESFVPKYSFKEDSFSCGSAE